MSSECKNDKNIPHSTGSRQTHRLYLTKVNGRASRSEHRSADNGDTRKTRVQARINTDAGVKNAWNCQSAHSAPEHGAEYRGTAADYTRIGVADKPIPEARPFTLVSCATGRVIVVEVGGIDIKSIAGSSLPIRRVGSLFF